MSRVLNRLVYQKAGWVLHMLRGTIGTDNFWTGIREYYRRYRNQNASTDDFRQVMEQAAGVPALVVLRSVAHAAGHAVAARRLALRCRREAGAHRDRAGAGRRCVSGCRSRSRIVSASGPARVETIELTAATGQFAFAADAEPASVTLDPEHLGAESASS